jgi:hypothetical protein
MVQHMTTHMLFDLDLPTDCCGFCLSTGTFCSIQLKKRKGRDGTNYIDMEHSRCPNLGNLGLVNAAKTTDRQPRTNVPDYCAVPACLDVVWKYNLQSHIRHIHPAADIDLYKSHYTVSSGEQTKLKAMSQKKPRQRKGKTTTFKISEAHGTQSALG